MSSKREVRELQQRLLGLKTDNEIVKVFLKDVESNNMVDAAVVLEYLNGEIALDSLALEENGRIYVCWEDLDSPWNDAILHSFLDLYISKHPNRANKEAMRIAEEHWNYRLKQLHKMLLRAVKWGDIMGLSPAEAGMALGDRIREQSRVGARKKTVSFRAVLLYNYISRSLASFLEARYNFRQRLQQFKLGCASQHGGALGQRWHE